MALRRLTIALLGLLILTGVGFAARTTSRKWVKRAVSVHNFEWRDRSGQRRGLGSLDDVIGPTDIKYPTIGAGGEVVVDMGEGDEIIDLPGEDFRVYEVGTAEEFWVLGAQEISGPWHFIGYGVGISNFDLSGTPLRWVRYLALADYECVVEGTPSEGADFDAVENFHLNTGKEKLVPVEDYRSTCLIGKWRYDGRFNSKPNAISSLLKAYDGAIRPPFPSQFDYVDSDVEDKFFSSAILFMTGHRNFSLDKKQQDALREYIERGGFLLGDACCQNQTFGDAFYREMGKVFPNDGFVKLPPDHEIYSCYYSLSSKNLPLYAVIRDGRALMVFSPNGLVCTWEGTKCPVNHRTIPKAEAMQLGINLIVYALTN